MIFGADSHKSVRVMGNEKRIIVSVILLRHGKYNVVNAILSVSIIYEQTDQGEYRHR